MMRDLELRLALVCYGGSSLAIYMNGISAELLSAARASTLLERPQSLNPDLPVDETTRLYAELLQSFQPKRRLSLVIDVVSGASAGGINGIFLTRALAHDLSLEPVRKMWIELGDVEELMANYSLAGRFNKIYLAPFLWLIARSYPGFDRFDEETKSKLMRFMRSKWFKPPFSGETMLTWMVDAGLNMGRAPALAMGSNQPRYSLMPVGHKLDLFVSVTNFFGERRNLKLHDPSSIVERAHGKSLSFQYLRRLSGAGYSDFSDRNAAALGFAARATSSFPGAFPPVSLNDLNRHLGRRKLEWAHRDQFMERNFADQIARPEGRRDLDKMLFLDGGIVNNKPFTEAISAMVKRPAQKPVDRRLIFVDPAPALRRFASSEEERPGFFRTILGAAVAIPNNQPIYEDLRHVTELSQNAVRLATALKASRSAVSGLVESIVKLEDCEDVSADTLKDWRVRSADLAYMRAGFAYGTYLHIRILRTFDTVLKILVKLLRRDKGTVDEPKLRDLLYAWAHSKGLMVAGDDAQAEAQILQASLDFLKAFDLDYRIRNIRTMIDTLNGHAMLVDDSDETSNLLQKAKRRLYRGVDLAEQKQEISHYPTGLFDQLDPHALELRHIDELMDALKIRLNIDGLDKEYDRFLAPLINQMPATELRESLFRAYAAFAFEDIVVLPLIDNNSMRERQPVKIVRISPQESAHMSKGMAHGPLLGTSLFNFGAFFSRRARENDYLWGRLHGADRMVDLIISSGGRENLPKDFDVGAFKRKIWRSIMQTEAAKCTEIPDILDALQKKWQD